MYLRWHFSVALSDPLQASLCVVCGIWIDFSLVFVENPVGTLVAVLIFLQFFFPTNNHAPVSTLTYTVFSAHTHTLKEDKSKLAWVDSHCLGLVLFPLPLYASLPLLKEKTCSELRLWYGNVMVVEEGRTGGWEVNSSECCSVLDCFHCKGNVLS